MDKKQLIESIVKNHDWNAGIVREMAEVAIEETAKAIFQDLKNFEKLPVRVNNKADFLIVVSDIDKLKEKWCKD